MPKESYYSLSLQHCIIVLTLHKERHTHMHAQTIRWAQLAQSYPDVLALSEPHNNEAVNLTYGDCESLILQAGAGLASLGLTRAEPVSVLCKYACTCSRTSEHTDSGTHTYTHAHAHIHKHKFAALKASFIPFCN